MTNVLAACGLVMIVVTGALTYSYATFVSPLRHLPSVLLFDGVCVLCNGFVRFVGNHDSRQLVRFASLQSNYGRSAVKEHGLGEGEASVRGDTLRGEDA